MKSEKAREYIYNHCICDIDLYESEEPATGVEYTKALDALTAIKIAEEQSKKKALYALESAIKDVDASVDIKHLVKLIKKFKRELAKDK